MRAEFQVGLSDGGGAHSNYEACGRAPRPMNLLDWAILAIAVAGAWRGGLRGAMGVTITLFGYLVALWMGLTHFQAMAHFLDVAFDAAGRIGQALQPVAAATGMVHSAAYWVTRLVDDLGFLLVFVLSEIPFAIAAFLFRSQGVGLAQNVNRILGAALGCGQYLLILTIFLGLGGQLGGLPVIGPTLAHFIAGSFLAPHLTGAFNSILPLAKTLMNTPI